MPQRPDSPIRRIVQIYDRYGMSSRLLEDIKRDILKSSDIEGLDVVLKILLDAQDLKGIYAVIRAGAELTERQYDQIAAAMVRVPFYRLVETDGWYSLFPRLLVRSTVLRSHIFRWFGSTEAASNDPMLTSARQNILRALRDIKLTGEETSTIKRLTPRLSAADRDYCHDVLLEQMNESDREEALTEMTTRYMERPSAGCDSR